MPPADDATSPNELPALTQLIGLGEVAKLCGTNGSTVWRWGVRGARVPKSEAAPTGRLFLATWLLPGRRVTTEAAVRSFISTLTRLRRPGPAAATHTPHSPAARRREAARVDSLLDSLRV
jgi:hypothetical protein